MLLVVVVVVKAVGSVAALFCCTMSSHAATTVGSTTLSWPDTDTDIDWSPQPVAGPSMFTIRHKTTSEPQQVNTTSRAGILDTQLNLVVKAVVGGECCCCGW